MPFQVSRSVSNNTTLIHLSDNNHSIRVTIIPQAGAILHEFILPVAGEPFNIIENYSLQQPVKEQVKHYFKSVKLSPWVCRLAGGKYHFDNRDFQVERLFSDGTALHGLLFDQEFRVLEESSDESSASVLLGHHYTGFDPGFPFHYECRVKYTLHGAGELEVETIITNLHSSPIPVADGWHPYFRLGGKVNDWVLHFHTNASILEFDEGLIPTGKLEKYERFNDPAPLGLIRLDNCFLLEQQQDAPSCTLTNPANNLSISFFPETGYPYLQVFIPEHRDSIAIENLSGAPDCFNNGMGLIVLPPGQAHTCRVFYKADVKENS